MSVVFFFWLWLCVVTNRRIEFNGKQRVTFKARRNNNLELQVRSADTARRVMRVRENQVEEFIRAYEARGTPMTNDNNDNKRKICN